MRLLIYEYYAQAFLGRNQYYKKNVDKVSCFETQHLVLASVEPAKFDHESDALYCTTALHMLLLERNTISIETCYFQNAAQLALWNVIFITHTIKRLRLAAFRTQCN